MSGQSEQQEPYRLAINQRTFDVRDLSPDCAFEIITGDDGDVYLVCTASARIFGLTATEVESFAKDVLKTVEQVRQSRPVPQSAGAAPGPFESQPSPLSRDPPDPPP